MAYTPSPRNCLEMPENHVASLPRPRRVPNMACTLCPKIAMKYLNIRLCPYRGQDASRTWPTYHAQKCLKIGLRPSCVPDMARTMTHPEHGLYTVPKNCPEMSENQAPSPPWLGRVLDMAYTP
ncbi:Hypothetical predicted protein [Olea europaea subsp. europaea]|uniref:Uncharacterized protein n=1 Tax=Olea europaea subsp. europaea TaxID=158383 RepID=A0A8S0T9T5_OLEEU|nr:Hypothetical predicted protein [Olea europaea subsp. europaea]